MLKQLIKIIIMIMHRADNRDQLGFREWLNLLLTCINTKMQQVPLTNVWICWFVDDKSKWYPNLQFQNQFRVKNASSSKPVAFMHHEHNLYNHGKGLPTSCTKLCQTEDLKGLSKIIMSNFCTWTEKKRLIDSVSYKQAEKAVDMDHLRTSDKCCINLICY